MHNIIQELFYEKKLKILYFRVMVFWDYYKWGEGKVKRRSLLPHAWQLVLVDIEAGDGKSC